MEPAQSTKTAHTPTAQRRTTAATAYAQPDTRESTAQAFSLQGAIHNSPRQVAQRRAVDDLNASPRQVAQRQQAAAATPTPNTTGLPDGLKAGVENLSGHSLDDVQVQYNSARPAQLQAHAYAQGSEIHVAPGQEQHLPHEAWHVVQQKQGRVRATTQLKGVGVNDDSGLEQEADAMGARAASPGANPIQLRPAGKLAERSSAEGVVQRVVAAGRFNLIGENHDDSAPRREEEKAMLNEKYGISADNYWEESAFKGQETTDEGQPRAADPLIPRLRTQLLAFITEIAEDHEIAEGFKTGIHHSITNGLERYWASLYEKFLILFHADMSPEGKQHQQEHLAVNAADKARLASDKNQQKFDKADEAVRELIALKKDEAGAWLKDRNKSKQREKALVVRGLLHEVDQIMAGAAYAIGDADAVEKNVQTYRENAMIEAANRAADAGTTGAWKIGRSHEAQMRTPVHAAAMTDPRFTLTNDADFSTELEAYRNRAPVARVDNEAALQAAKAKLLELPNPQDVLQELLQNPLVADNPELLQMVLAMQNAPQQQPQGLEGLM